MTITSKDITEKLFEQQDLKYKDFTSAIMPGSRPVIGVRLPILRKMAKEIAKGDWRTFINVAPEDYFEEVQLKGFAMAYAKASYEEILPFIENHIPKINDWSLCDSFCTSLKIIEKHREEFLQFLLPYAKVDDEFKQRVVAVMLMDYYLTDDYIEQTLRILDGLKNEKYYCKMAVAWAVATAASNSSCEAKLYCS